MARRWQEYEFDMPDGSKRYEIVDLERDDMRPTAQCFAFQRMHGARGWRPAK